LVINQRAKITSWVENNRAPVINALGLQRQVVFYEVMVFPVPPPWLPLEQVI